MREGGRWRLLSERLVRSFVVVLAAKRVEGALLTPQVGARWSRRLGLERAMEALLATIVLRLTWRDPLDLNTKLYPPYGQLREAACAHRSERRSVVRANRGGQSELLERSSTPSQRIKKRECASMMVSGEQRLPSPVAKCPLKSTHQVAFGTVTLANG